MAWWMDHARLKAVIDPFGQPAFRQTPPRERLCREPDYSEPTAEITHLLGRTERSGKCVAAKISPNIGLGPAPTISPDSTAASEPIPCSSAVCHWGNARYIISDFRPLKIGRAHV